MLQKCFYMMRIKSHSSAVYSADVVHFLEAHALNRIEHQSHLRWIMVASIKRTVALILAQPVSECLVQNASLLFPSGLVSSHIKTKNRGKYFICAVSASVSRHDAWQIIEK